MSIGRLSVQQYHAMARAGIFPEGAPVELLGGWLVSTMPKSPPHSGCTRLIRKALAPILPMGWEVDSHGAITTDDSEPEPDIALIRSDLRDYVDRHPGPGDVAKIVEVADFSIERDRGIKKSVYAHARIPIYWIVNIPERQVEVYTDPAGTGEEADYQQRRDYGVAETVPVVLNGREIARIAVRDLLP
jgi:Uma2 family endonuclease